MHPVLVLYSCLAVGLAWLAIKLKEDVTGPLASVPGPWWSRFTRFPLKIAILKGKRIFFVHDLHKRYGPIVRLGPQEVSITKPSEVKSVYRVASPFLKDDAFYSGFTGNLPQKSLFTMIDPKQHAVHRKLQANSFGEKWVRKMEPIVQRSVQLAISKMSRDLKSLGYFDAFRWFMFMATDSIGESSFGTSFETLQKEEDSQYMKDLRKTANIGVIRTELGFLGFLFKYIPLKSTRELQAIVSRLLNNSEEFIQRYWKMYHADPENVKPTLLTKEFTAAMDGVISHEQLKRDGQGYLVAGTDTTANTCSQLVWHVSKHPEVHRRLVEEVSKLPADFTDEDLKQIPYIQYIINETLRIAGPASDHLPRIVPHGGATFSGHVLPEATLISTQAYTLHLDPTAFKNPEKFDPLRWENPTPEMKEAFMPFGGGSRICIGMHFAQMEIRHAIANFYRTFPNPLTKSDKHGFTDADMDPKAYFLIVPRGGRCLLTEAPVNASITA